MLVVVSVERQTQRRSRQLLMSSVLRIAKHCSSVHRSMQSDIRLMGLCGSGSALTIVVVETSRARLGPARVNSNATRNGSESLRCVGQAEATKAIRHFLDVREAPQTGAPTRANHPTSARVVVPLVRCGSALKSDIGALTKVRF